MPKLPDTGPADTGPISLWRNRSFVRLWFARAVSSIGTQVTSLALPLTAITLLDATPIQIGYLGIASRAPSLLFDLFAGVWIDRTQRRPILVGADLGRALLLGTIPLAALLGYLTFAQLYLVTFLVGILTTFFSLASISILPSLVKRGELVEANSKLAATDSVLSIAAPGMAGGLIQFLSAPKAILLDALSYLLSMFSLHGMSAPEKPSNITARASIWTEIGEGIYELVRTPILRALAISVSIGTFGLVMQEAVLLLYFVDDLEFTPATIGFIGAVSGVGALVGALNSGWVARYLGIGPTIILGNFLWAIGVIIIPLVGANLLLISGGQIVAKIGAAIWSVNQMSLRQSITPVHLFARATAARRVLMIGLQIIGAALGGLLGTVIGFQATLIIGSAGLMIGSLFLVSSPVRTASV